MEKQLVGTFLLEIDKGYWRHRTKVGCAIAEMLLKYQNTPLLLEYEETSHHENKLVVYKVIE